MKTTRNNSQDRGEQVPVSKANQIKLGIDVHADFYVVVRQLDGQNPQPPQRFQPTAFLQWVRSQLPPAHSVHSCYEAGPFGYGLHRQLCALGVHNVVVAPQRLDERHRGVKTDKTDARALVLKLDQYVNGNRYALAVIRVPSPEEEQRRAVVRQRDQFARERRRLEAMGRSLLLQHGYRVRGAWWRGMAWQRLSNGSLPAWLLEPLQRLQVLVVAVHQQRQALTAQLAAAAPAKRVRGLGGLTHQSLQCELCDWRRFRNPAAGGQLYRVMSAGGFQRRASPPGQHQQTWPSASAGAAH